MWTDMKTVRAVWSRARVSRSSFPSRLWDIECGACLRVLEGHEELVRCIRFDNKRIVSGAYDGWVFHIAMLCRGCVRRERADPHAAVCAGPGLGRFCV